MRWLALALSLLAGPVFAGCSDERVFVLERLEQSGWRVEKIERAMGSPDVCVLYGLVLVEDAMRVEVAQLSWQLDGRDALQSASGNVDLSVTVKNAQITAQTSDPWVSYMLRQQNRRNKISASLQIGWDLDEGALQIIGARVALPGKNSVYLDSRVQGLGPEVFQGRGDVLLGMTVQSVEVEVVNHGFLDGLILGALVGRLSGVAGSPEAVVAGTQAELNAMIAAWPDTVFDARSKAALAAFVDAGPVPWGRASLVLGAEAGLPLSRFLSPVILRDPLSPEAMATAFEGAVVRFLFTPADEDG